MHWAGFAGMYVAAGGATPMNNSMLMALSA
jgi:hypothetical protein